MRFSTILIQCLSIPSSTRGPRFTRPWGKSPPLLLSWMWKGPGGEWISPQMEPQGSHEARPWLGGVRGQSIIRLPTWPFSQVRQTSLEAQRYPACRVSADEATEFISDQRSCCVNFVFLAKSPAWARPWPTLFHNIETAGIRSAFSYMADEVYVCMAGPWPE